MSRLSQTFFDVTARRPSGWLGRAMYRRPVGHYGFFRLAIETLQLRPEDVFLEVGCGGGVMLEMVLPAVRQAAGIDHSPDMVDLARERNAEAVSDGRAEVVQGSIEALPWGDDRFTCAAGIEMLGFVENPDVAFAELHRVLKPEGRLVFVTAAEPDSGLARLLYLPWLERLRIHSDEELARMLSGAGFGTVRVERMDRTKGASSACQLAYAVK